MNTTRNDLELRIARLERRSRIWRALLLVGALIGLTAMTHGDGSLRVRSLELIDQDGAVRAALRLEDGNPVLALADDHGTERIRLFHAADATGLYIMDAEATTRVGIAQFAHGGGGVALHGPQSKGAAVLYFKGEGSLRFFDRAGTVTVQVPPLAAPAP